MRKANIQERADPQDVNNLVLVVKYHRHDTKFQDSSQGDCSANSGHAISALQFSHHVSSPNLMWRISNLVWPNPNLMRRMLAFMRRPKISVRTPAS